MAKKTKQATKDPLELLADEIPAKDEEELHLEKLVFGDTNGFEQNLKQIDNLYEDDYDELENDQQDGDVLFTYDDESDEDLHDEFLDGLSQKKAAESSDEDGSDEEEEEEIEDVNDDKLFFHDDSGDEADEDAMDVDSDGNSSDDQDDDDEGEDEEGDAWIDSEDENLEITLISNDKLKKLRKKDTEVSIKGKAYIQRLRTQFEKIYPRPEWADKFEEDEEADGDNNNNSDDINSDDDNEINQLTDVVRDQAKTLVKNSSNPLLEFLNTNQSYNNQSSSKILPPNKIDISRLTDANVKHTSRSAIQSLHFHPSQPLLLTGGYDRSLRIYHIDGKVNKLITSLFLKKSSIQSAYFNTLQDTTQILSGGRRRYMYKWDVELGSIEKISRLYGHEDTQRSFENFKISPNGKYIVLMGNSGWLNLLDARTSQWIKGFKIEGELVDFDVSHDLNKPVLIAINRNGDVWEWDIESGKILDMWSDESGTGVTKVKIGGVKTNRWLAIGSNIGLVNVYDRLKPVKKPVGVIENLVTTISSIEFSNDGQLMCIASRDKKDALRLVHLPTCKTYSNWPTSGTPLGKVTNLCFSPNNEMLATGNEAGKVRLWKLNHY